MEYVFTMSIDLRIAEVFYILDCCGNVASVPKAPFISDIPLFFILDMHVAR